MSAIFRAPRPDTGYFDVRNETVRDQRLSYRARGVLLRLLSNADGFSMTAIDLAEEGKEGRDAIRKAFAELESAKYMIKIREQTEKGFWVTKTYIFDTPQQNDAEDDNQSHLPKPENPHTPEKPTVGKSGAKSRTTNQTTFSTKKEINSENDKYKLDTQLKVAFIVKNQKDIENLNAMIETHGRKKVLQAASEVQPAKGSRKPYVSTVYNHLHSNKKGNQNANSNVNNTPKAKFDEDSIKRQIEQFDEFG
jgi:hypothetical protein